MGCVCQERVVSSVLEAASRVIERLSFLHSRGARLCSARAPHTTLRRSSEESRACDAWL